MAYPIDAYHPGNGGESVPPRNLNLVDDMRPSYDDETKEAVITEYDVLMQDDTEYKLSKISPKNRSIDVTYLRTPAWTTSHNKGYERAYALAMASLGMTVYSLTPQQNLFRVGNMRRSAHDYIEIGRSMATEDGLTPDHFVTGGSSRGGMYSLAMARAARAHGSSVDYIDSISPSVPLPALRSNLGRAARRLLHEPATLLRIARNDTTGHTGILLDTIARPPREAFQQGKEFFTLADGSVGRMTRRLPEDSFGFVQQFDTDGLADPDEWPALLDPFQRVYQRLSPGTHMDCVSPKTMLESIGRVGDVRDGYISGAMGSISLQQLVAVGNPRFEGNTGPQLTVVPAS